MNYYGKTKLAGENVILAGGISSAILRTIVVYGTGINVKNNFALWVISSLREAKNIRCVDDQIGNPTHVSDLAANVLKVIEQGLYGTVPHRWCGCCEQERICGEGRRSFQSECLAYSEGKKQRPPSNRDAPIDDKPCDNESRDGSRLPSDETGAGP